MATKLWRRAVLEFERCGAILVGDNDVNREVQVVMVRGLDADVVEDVECGRLLLGCEVGVVFRQAGGGQFVFEGALWAEVLSGYLEAE